MSLGDTSTFQLSIHKDPLPSRMGFTYTGISDVSKFFLNLRQFSL